MSLSQIEHRYVTYDKQRACQGDILKDVTIIESIQETSDGIETIETNLPYAIILTQDCDLEQDHNSRGNNRYNLGHYFTYENQIKVVINTYENSQLLEDVL